MKKLEGKTALVTGAGGGIGSEIALAFARQGASIVLSDRTATDRLNYVAEECLRVGSPSHIVPANIADATEVSELVSQAIALLGHLDILVNAGGILTQSLVSEMPDELWDEMIAINLRSVFLVTRRVLPQMIDRQYGRIISISSQLGIKGGPELAHYAAAKAGILGFTKSLAREVGHAGITANCIAPGPIETPMLEGISPGWKEAKSAQLPLGRFGVPSEVAPTAVLLAADPDGSLYTGQTLGPNSGDVMP
jgi:3-oxoacyl-[acyl-carrier protein] reductase